MIVGFCSELFWLFCGKCNSFIHQPCSKLKSFVFLVPTCFKKRIAFAKISNQTLMQKKSSNFSHFSSTARGVIWCKTRENLKHSRFGWMWNFVLGDERNSAKKKPTSRNFNVLYKGAVFYNLAHPQASCFEVRKNLHLSLAHVFVWFLEFEILIWK